MASDTVDPIDWSHPHPNMQDPLTASSIVLISAASAGIDLATTGCEATTLSMRYAATQGINGQSWCPFFNSVVFERDSVHRRSIDMLYKIRCNPMVLKTFNFHFIYTCAVFASSGYTQCLGRTSVYICASSLPILTVPQDFYTIISVSVEQFCRPCIRWCGTGGFHEQGQCFFIGLSCSLPFCLLHTVFPFSSSFL